MTERRAKVNLPPGGPAPLTRRDSKNSMEKFRRMSKAASMAFGIRRMSRFPVGERGSSGSSRQSQAPGPMIRLENTYRMEPHEDQIFNPEKATRIIQDVLTKYLKGEEYNHKTCPEKTQRLSELIRREMKDLGYQRYKLIVHAVIGENKDQGVEMVSRNLWLSQYDNWAEGTYKDKKIFGVVIVYAVYHE